MAEVQSAPAPLSVFQQAQEKQWYNMSRLEQHRLAEGQIYQECGSEEAVPAMAAANPNFLAEQRAVYDDVRAQAAVRQSFGRSWRRITPVAPPKRRRRTISRPGGTKTVPTPPFPSWTSFPPATDRSRTPPRMSTAREAAVPCVPCGHVCLPCSTLPRRRPHLNFIGLIADTHGDGGRRTTLALTPSAAAVG